MNTQSTKIDWDHIDDTWYIAGFGCTHLDEAMLHSGGSPDWTCEDMDQLFLHRAKVDEESTIPVLWDAFDQEYGGIVYRLGRNELLKAVLAYSRDKNSIRATADIYLEVEEKLGICLGRYGDRCSSILPDFYYDQKMTIEDFFFEKCLPRKIAYQVVNPIKYAAWVRSDRRWDVLVTVDSI